MVTQAAQEDESETAAPEEALSLAPLEGVIGFRLRRLQGRFVSHWSRLFRDLHPQITPVQGGILLLVEGNPGLTQVGLSRLLQVETPTLLQSLSPLIEADLIARQRSPRDRRAYELRLTDAGHSAADTVRSVTARHESALLGALTARERDTLLRLLDKAIAGGEERSGNQ
ncbi:MarR family winged helix-turn-helix transcriptional regulator [Amorphus sp. 3PC139-8]|uniref:MarR family winged helix-turn-helix transcriptional regulator n=1 Tax=Amorphus sp. 3PC139-8 TaxID=2735676 RepID=UPI00345D7A31